MSFSSVQRIMILTPSLSARFPSLGRFRRFDPDYRYRSELITSIEKLLDNRGIKIPDIWHPSDQEVNRELLLDLISWTRAFIYVVSHMEFLLLCILLTYPLLCIIFSWFDSYFLCWELQIHCAGWLWYRRFNVHHPQIDHLKSSQESIYRYDRNVLNMENNIV